MSGGLTVGLQLHLFTLILSAPRRSINQHRRKLQQCRRFWSLFFFFRDPLFIRLGRWFTQDWYENPNFVTKWIFCRFFIVEIFFNPKSKCYYLFISCYKLMYFLIYSQSKNLLSSSLWSSEILTARAKNLVKSKSSLNKRQAYWEYSLSFKLCFDFHQFGEICGRNICCAARWAGSTCGFIHLHLETKQVEAVTLNHSRTASVALKETLTCKKPPG